MKVLTRLQHQTDRIMTKLVELNLLLQTFEVPMVMTIKIMYLSPTQKDPGLDNMMPGQGYHIPEGVVIYEYDEMVKL
jgi:hypothetical protein